MRRALASVLIVAALASQPGCLLFPEGAYPFLTTASIDGDYIVRGRLVGESSAARPGAVVTAVSPDALEGFFASSDQTSADGSFAVTIPARWTNICNILLVIPAVCPYDEPVPIVDIVELEVTVNSEVTRRAIPVTPDQQTETPFGSSRIIELGDVVVPVPR